MDAAECGVSPTGQLAEGGGRSGSAVGARGVHGVVMWWPRAVNSPTKPDAHGTVLDGVREAAQRAPSPDPLGLFPLWPKENPDLP